jgi:hypothetical protein
VAAYRVGGKRPRCGKHAPRPVAGGLPLDGTIYGLMLVLLTIWMPKGILGKVLELAASAGDPLWHLYFWLGDLEKSLAASGGRSRDLDVATGSIPGERKLPAVDPRDMERESARGEPKFG